MLFNELLTQGVDVMLKYSVSGCHKNDDAISSCLDGFKKKKKTELQNTETCQDIKVHLCECDCEEQNSCYFSADVCALSEIFPSLTGCREVV